MDFKLERDMHSFSKAQKLGLDVDPATSEVDIPVFYAEGLEVGTVAFSISLCLSLSLSAFVVYNHRLLF